MTRGSRRALTAAGALGLGLAGAVVAGRAAVRRDRARPDPEAGTPLGELPPDDLGRVRSFDGTELAVRAAGPAGAPTLVFAHGITLDMTTWHYQWKAFSDRYRCVLFDHRSHGRSGGPPGGDHSLEAMGDDIRTVLEHAGGTTPAVLVGHSMGGMAILSFADRHPGELDRLVAGVVLVDTAASDIVRDLLGVAGARLERAARPVADRALWSRPARAERVRRLVDRWGRDLAYLIARTTNFGPGASPAQVDHVTRLSTSARVEVWTDMLRGLLELDLREALEAIDVPALVVVGDRDALTPKASAHAIADALPDARAVAISGAGHLSMMERHEVFNRILDEHLERVFGARRATG